MKKSKALDALDQSLRQANTTGTGFLGTDERPLKSILQDDDHAVRKLGLTHADIAQKMVALRRAGWDGLGEPVAVPPHLEVCVDAARGTIPCPFGDQDAIAKVNTTVRNLASGERVVFSDLNIHLIAAHGFYEGRGAQFRLDPEQLRDALEIGNGFR